MRRRPEIHNGALTIGLVAASHGLYVVVVVAVLYRFFFCFKTAQCYSAMQFPKRRKKKVCSALRREGEEEQKEEGKGREKKKKSIAKATSFCPAVVSSIIAVSRWLLCVLLFMFTLLFSLRASLLHTQSLFYILLFLSIYFVVYCTRFESLFAFWRE